MVLEYHIASSKIIQFLGFSNKEILESIRLNVEKLIYPLIDDFLIKEKNITPIYKKTELELEG